MVFLIFIVPLSKAALLRLLTVGSGKTHGGLAAARRVTRATELLTEFSGFGIERLHAHGPRRVDDMSTEDMPGNMTDGFHLVVEALKLNGVDTIYGVAGIPITDLLRLAQAEGIRYFGFRHEQSAGNAAAITGFLTQKPGICMTVSAPGFLNGMVALANATPNCSPMILISGS
ncbi:MAG TPA: thiamine pyrophosphate-binding protein, partial [Stellaceae bacterium]|nr:thiamine pyrophosphate-binding protein [Stellaceae bacterium]